MVTSDGPSNTKRLRVAQLTIQPTLVWDDGEELSAGPQVEAKTLTLTQAAEFIANLPNELEKLAEQLNGEETGDTGTNPH